MDNIENVIQLKSIEEELLDCVEAFKSSKPRDLTNFCHHDFPLEVLSYSPARRIEHITQKSINEQALRFHLFRPIKHPINPNNDYKQALIVYEQACIAYEQLYMAGQKHNIFDEARVCNQAFIAFNLVYLKYFKEIFGTPWKDSIFATFKVKYQEQEEENTA